MTTERKNETTLKVFLSWTHPEYTVKLRKNIIVVITKYSDGTEKKKFEFESKQLASECFEVIKQIDISKLNYTHKTYSGVVIDIIKNQK